MFTAITMFVEFMKNEDDWIEHWKLAAFEGIVEILTVLFLFKDFVV